MNTTNNPAAEEQPYSSSSSLKGPSAVENQAFEFDFDVFLSFRGEDTRRGFTSHLHQKLKERGLRAFKDDEDLKKGERITTLIHYIERSNIFIPILSKSYAESRWCLMEIAKIVQCKRLIIPVFYDVDPSDVRGQKGPFSKGFDEHQEKQDAEKVKEWRQALNQVGEISGYDLTAKAVENEANLINVIVKIVQRALRKIPMEVATHSFGIESRVDHMLKLLDLNTTTDVRMVGIYGEGGLGKTTISKAVYNELHQTFEGGSCFILNVRERSNQPNYGLVSLQAQLLKEILKDNESSINDVEQGISSIKQRLRSKRILLVLDDVDSREQLNKLAGDCAWFGAGSRIIISTRDEGLLDKHRVVLKYKPEELDREQSLQLFSRHAFESDQPHPDYLELSRSVVKYAGGMPLALEVFGPMFFTIRNQKEWLEMLGQLKSVQHEDLSKRLRISYEALNQQEQCIFLDIACCFLRRKTRDPQYMWKAMSFYPSVTIKALQQKSLVKIDEDGVYFAMHDQIRDMGRKIVKEEAFYNPGKRSRLWDESEILPELEQPSDKLEVITLHCRGTAEVSGAAFAQMPNLRFLRLENVAFEDEVLRFPRSLKTMQLSECQSEAPAFDTSKLQQLLQLDLLGGKFSKISWNHEASKLSKRQANNMMPNLKVLNLNSCWKLTATPDFCGFTKLEELVLDRCFSLTTIDDSIGQLMNLTRLSMKECRKLKHLPDSVCELKNLETLILEDCRGICDLPERLGELESLKELNLSCTGLRKLPTCITQLTRLSILQLRQTYLEELPEEIGRLKSLKKLGLKICLLKRIPDSIGDLTSLKVLNLSNTRISKLPDSIEKMSNLSLLHLFGCDGIRVLPERLGELESLEELGLSHTGLIKLPDSIGKLINLSRLSLSWCGKLEHLPDSICELKNLESLDLQYSRGICELPERLGELESLKELNLIGTGLTKLPTSIGDLTSLEVLNLERTHIRELPDSIGKLINLPRLSLHWCEKLEHLPDGICELKNLHTLTLEECSGIYELPERLGELESLKELNLRNSGLTKLPTSIGDLTSLKELNLERTDISELPDSIGKLINLSCLILYWCEELVHLPDSICELKNLRTLELPECSGLCELPERLGELESLTGLNLSDTGLRKLPTSIGKLINLWRLSLSYCGKLEHLPDGICELKNLHTLNLEECSGICELPERLGELKSLKELNLKQTGLKKLPTSIGDLTSLKVLNLERTHIRELPDSIGKLINLPRLSLRWCEKLEYLPDGICELKNLHTLNLEECSGICELPERLGELESLKELNLSRTRVKKLPTSIGDLTSLKVLNLERTHISDLPDSIGKLINLWRLSLCSCEKLGHLPDSICELKNLEILDLGECSGICELPERLGELESLKNLNLSRTGLTRLPTSIGDLTSLEILNLEATHIERCRIPLGRIANSVGWRIEVFWKNTIGGARGFRQLFCLP